MARSPIIEAAVRHRNEAGLLHIDVPEWVVDGRPTRIYWKLMTLAEWEVLAQKGQSNADLLIMKALDANGNKLFTLEDKPELRNAVFVDVVERISKALIGERPKTQEEAEKNSAAT
jgi:hypothetical protein